MSTQDDGGPAFPRSPHSGDPSDDGMSLRDWFAGQALLYCAQGDFEKFEHLAEDAYAIADAMIAKREDA
jgi:hypothetical protein